MRFVEVIVTVTWTFVAGSGGIFHFIFHFGSHSDDELLGMDSLIVLFVECLDGECEMTM